MDKKETRIERWRKLHDDFRKYTLPLPAVSEANFRLALSLVGIRKFFEEYLSTPLSPGVNIFGELSSAVGEAEACEFLLDLREYLDIVEKYFIDSKNYFARDVNNGYVPNSMDKLNLIEQLIVGDYLVNKDFDHKLRDKMQARYNNDKI